MDQSVQFGLRQQRLAPDPGELIRCAVASQDDGSLYVLAVDDVVQIDGTGVWCRIEPAIVDTQQIGRQITQARRLLVLLSAGPECRRRNR
jgi:hypothetical protein